LASIWISLPFVSLVWRYVLGQLLEILEELKTGRLAFFGMKLAGEYVVPVDCRAELIAVFGGRGYY